MATTYHPWRIAAATLGIAAIGLGCYGAYEYALKLEGNVSYLVLAAPLIGAFAGLIAPMAEATWRGGERVKASLWWLVLIPAAAFVFFAAAERVHHAKASAMAERGAFRASAERAQAKLTEAKAEEAKARAAADKTLGWKQCGTQCLGIRATADARKVDREAAEKALFAAQSKATSEAPLQAPVWLLPTALDLVGFMAIWTGFAGPWWSRGVEPVRSVRKVRAKRADGTPTKAVKPLKGKPRKRIAALANDNVFNLPAAGR